MIRISKLLRVAKSASKIPVRGGPGWDRPDVPPTQRTETDQRVYNEFILVVSYINHLHLF
jgi:hypothetical protein